MEKRLLEQLQGRKQNPRPTFESPGRKSPTRTEHGFKKKDGGFNFPKNKKSKAFSHNTACGRSITSLSVPLSAPRGGAKPPRQKPKAENLVFANGRSAHPDGSEKGGPDPNPTAPKKAASLFKHFGGASEFFHCVII